MKDHLENVRTKGESDIPQPYEFTDHKPKPAENLYRLKMIDTDGTYGYSQIRSVRFDHGDQIALFPNPVTVEQTLNLETDHLDQIKHIQFFNTSGKRVFQAPPARQMNISELDPGLYVVRVTYLDGSISTHRIVKQ